MKMLTRIRGSIVDSVVIRQKRGLLVRVLGLASTPSPAHWDSLFESFDSSRKKVGEDRRLIKPKDSRTLQVMALYLLP